VTYWAAGPKANRKAPNAKGVAMMARKATNLLGSVSLMGGRLRRVTDK
jgi:hypothetical protein